MYMCVCVCVCVCIGSCINSWPCVDLPSRAATSVHTHTHSIPFLFVHQLLRQEQNVCPHTSPIHTHREGGWGLPNEGGAASKRGAHVRCGKRWEWEFGGVWGIGPRPCQIRNARGATSIRAPVAGSTPLQASPQTSPPTASGAMTAVVCTPQALGFGRGGGSLGNWAEGSCWPCCQRAVGNVLRLSACLPACLPARPPACPPACLPACLRPTDCPTDTRPLHTALLLAGSDGC
jgi:hypothetical protein